MEDTGDHFDSTVTPDMLEWVVYLMTAILVVPGLLGNVLLFCMSLRTDIRKFSYRFIAIVFPLKRKALCTVRNAYISCSLVFIFCLTFEIPETLTIHFIDMDDHHLCLSDYDDALFRWGLVESFINTVGPCVLLLGFNSYTLVVIKRGMRKRKAMMDGTNCTAQAAVNDPETQRRHTDVTSIQPETCDFQTEASSGTTATGSHDPRKSSPTQRGTNQEAEASLGYAEASHGQRELSGRQGRESQQSESSREQNRQKQQQREASREQREVTKVLLSLPIFTFVVLIPHTMTVSFVLEFSKFSVDLRNFVLASEAYFRMIYSLSFVSNFYLLVATSKSYRKLTRDMLCCSRS